MSNIIDTNSSVALLPCVTFQWGPFTAHYARTTEALTLGGFLFTSVPRLGIVLGSQSGGAKDVPVKITMPSDLLPISTILSQLAHARVAVRIEEVSPDDLSTLRPLFRGWVSKVIGNSGGMSGMSEVEVVGIRSLLESALGMISGPRCTWVFGDPKTCRMSLVPLRVSTSVTNIVANKLHVSADLTAGIRGDAKWTYGCVSNDGIEIQIIRAISSSSLLLETQPPSYWMGKTVVLTPGCDGKSTSCLAYANIDRFGGVGVAMPDYHPLLETH